MGRPEGQRPRVGRVDAFQRRHRALGFPIAVVYKYAEDTGGYLAALIAYYAFVSLFPVLLLLATVLGYVLSGDPQLQHRILGSALSQFPVVGHQLADPRRLGGGVGGLVVGILGALYGGLGVAQALQYAMNTAWGVPRNSRPNPFSARGRSLVLLLTAGLAVVATSLLSGIAAGALGALGTLTTAATVAATMVVSAVIFGVTFRMATARELGWRDVAPGAAVAAVGWQILQTVGVVYVEHVINGASDTNGVFAVVLGLIAFLYLTGVIVVLATEVNVVRAERLHPRALLTPFTDRVRLTEGDRRSYTRVAKAQRSKGFERIVVAFDVPDFDVPDDDVTLAD